MICLTAVLYKCQFTLNLLLFTPTTVHIAFTVIYITVKLLQQNFKDKFVTESR